MPLSPIASLHRPSPPQLPTVTVADPPPPLQPPSTTADADISAPPPLRCRLLQPTLTFLHRRRCGLCTTADDASASPAVESPCHRSAQPSQPWHPLAVTTCISRRHKPPSSKIYF
ncbi:unnamed protein product [Cuscuta campestris]|uniref:Uncharacterized protein n=1 Tax=Cuscuta campestris TaxID=132261 RepID=A0A484KHM1_9ASTE|nr:unnamed protein product [Cuscuta campestris]